MESTTAKRAIPKTAGRSFSAPVLLTACVRVGEGSRVPITSTRRIPALDGLRGIAIALVLLYHAVFQLRPGPGPLSYVIAAGRLTWSGVDLFFVLSGFLIGGILLDEKNSRRYYGPFYARRAFRILPLYGLLVALCSLRYFGSAWMPQALGGFSSSPLPWASYLTFTQNVFMAALGTLGVGTLIPTWSLAVEEQFYLTMPWVVRKLRRRSLVRWLVGAVVAAPILRTVLFYAFPHGAIAAYVLMPARVDALSLGVLAAVLVRNQRAWGLLQSRRWLLRVASFALFAGLCWLTVTGADLYSLPMAAIGYSCLAFFYASCLLLAVSREHGTVHRLLTNGMLMQLGTVAYCVYLFHLPVIEICRRLAASILATSSELSILLASLAGIAITVLIIAPLSWRFFEKPLIGMGRRVTYG